MYVYLLTNPNRTVLYIGVTNDLTRRLAEHSNNLGNHGKFTGRYQANLLVYFEILPDATQAIAREKELKGWSRLKKEKLIAGFNPEWEAIDLETWTGPTIERHAERSEASRVPPQTLTIELLPHARCFAALCMTLSY